MADGWKNTLYYGDNLDVLRHSFGSALAMAGVPLPTIQTLMGHSDDDGLRALDRRAQRGGGPKAQDSGLAGR